jgi:hypothetical protein
MKRVIAPTTAAIAWTAVLVQMVYSLMHALERGDSFAVGLTYYFSYFTVLTNTLVALVLTVPYVAPSSPAARWLAHPRVSAMAASAIIVVGLAYHFLLSAINNPLGVEYVTDLGLHYFVPTLFTLHWVLHAPKAGLRYAHVPAFGIYPAAYFAYLMLRGAINGKYPYFFVDASTLGYLVAARNAAAILIFYFLVASLLLLLTARQRAEERA